MACCNCAIDHEIVVEVEVAYIVCAFEVGEVTGKDIAGKHLGNLICTAIVQTHGGDTALHGGIVGAGSEVVIHHLLWSHLIGVGVP